MRRSFVTVASLACLALQACVPGSKTPAEIAAQQQQTLEFCRSVPDAISSDDKICAPYFNRIKAEAKAAAAKKAAEDEAEASRNAAAFREANDPNRTLTEEELQVCINGIKRREENPDIRPSGALITGTRTSGGGFVWYRKIHLDNSYPRLYNCTKKEMTYLSN